MILIYFISGIITALFDSELKLSRAIFVEKHRFNRYFNHCSCQDHSNFLDHPGYNYVFSATYVFGFPENSGFVGNN